MFIKRKILPLLEQKLEFPEALILTGFRRVGKTTLIKHLFDELKTANKVFLDMESPVNQEIFQRKNYDGIASEIKKLGLKLEKEKAYVFLDEIQFVKNLPSVIKYLFDHYQIKFVATGSSSFYLKNHFTESLAGRKFIFELFPLDFEEFLWFKGEKFFLNAPYELLRPFYDEYMEYGGFPGVSLTEGIEDKKLKIDDALGSYFQLDVTHLATFHDRKNLQSLLFLLSSRAGTRLDTGKLSQSLGVSRQTLYNYIDFLEATYLIRLVPQYSSSSDVIVRKIPKLYFLDSGLLNRVGKISTGTLFENTVFNEFYTKNQKVNYFQKKSGAEIDFIVDRKGYEVKLTGTQTDVARLKKLSESLKLSGYAVISLEKTRQDNPKIIYPWFDSGIEQPFTF